ncbi:hypothetical protein D9Q98_001483 [Chlorella vulgaris]|uniref:Uncharacterized protein n=1 Tax=Chlorella vulgaris TaxID=3077 RepID=A0A9D4Z243_CHLVU|nr:hypothetical protein D9Q98_001483 [Chlorella vulgaris]
MATAALVCDVALRAVAQAAAGPGLASDAWVALCSNCVSFLILTSVFVDDQEWETAICYAAGLCGSLLLLAQACLLGMAPAPLLPTAALLAVLSVAINTAKARGWLDGPAAPTRLWGMWRGAVGCLGWAMVPQIAYLSLVLPATSGPDTLASSSWGPAAASICLGAALAALLRHRPSKALARQGRRRRSGGLFDSWSVPAWTATLLFMLEPVAALASAARTPEALLSLAPSDFLLPALATGLQVPRALLRDHMWFTGTSYATLFACAQAAVVACARGSYAAAAAALAIPLLCMTCLLALTAAAQGNSRPLRALQQVAEGYRREQLPLRSRARLLAGQIKRRLWHAAGLGPPFQP